MIEQIIMAALAMLCALAIGAIGIVIGAILFIMDGCR